MAAQIHLQPLPTKPYSPSSPLTTVEQAGLRRLAAIANEGRGDYSQQASKLNALCFSLKNSPVGLLAWIYKELHSWSDYYTWSDDDILTWVSIHYFSHPGPDVTGDIYYAMEHGEPTAVETARKLWNKTLGPVVFESDHRRGGHFTAWENLETIIHDLRSMFANPGDHVYAT
ncbi:hypothetical protein B0I35DRAFT_484661 [Stachybotrys elegans]|uniref:Epoxide hydrolase N-terminal domain-containing protein n=1 Tax=Stachybotrys elegans TaxID=80388 RepID=A0A8K0WJE6_9HYPO|nr:hypothetical protein B0I35DRAFT_484661 [Stachybotrys elegans]